MLETHYRSNRLCVTTFIATHYPCFEVKAKVRTTEQFYTRRVVILYCDMVLGSTRGTAKSQLHLIPCTWSGV
jgi:hypothetical protein